jgi:non-ribosomal peptide synthetase component E (peptide arylation enzyme)
MLHYICKIVNKFAEQKPDAIALKTNKASVTYYDLNKTIDSIASQFYNRFPSKTRIALHLPNSIEF